MEGILTVFRFSSRFCWKIVFMTQKLWVQKYFVWPINFGFTVFDLQTIKNDGNWVTFSFRQLVEAHSVFNLWASSHLPMLQGHMNFRMTEILSLEKLDITCITVHLRVIDNIVMVIVMAIGFNDIFLVANISLTLVSTFS